ncbi:MAG TPA: metallophosphoesterase, partial [Sphingomicrobium sp.]|nr:metallophosphoesterase [Sphingomicrobium sp.]
KGPVLRALTDEATCPLVRIDGHVRRMQLRSGPRQFPPRTSASGSAAMKPPNFPITICEKAVPRNARKATLAGKAAPLPPRLIRKIVVIGDTGCRLKATSSAWQACNISSDWPFARIAAKAAAARPDLVLHVGDYLYRENACPVSNSGCAGSPWGYGLKAWEADFLRPAAPLLAAAPWLMVRGNHEACNRAGAGWWMLLDPHQLTRSADCAKASEDFAGNHTRPYAVELGGKARIIVADFAAIRDEHLKGAALSRYRADAETIRGLAQSGYTNFVTSHYPFYALTMRKKELVVGYPSVDDAFGGGDFLPWLPHVTAMLAGHVHLLQYDARRGFPTQIVTGFSGTQEEAAEAPTGLASIRGLPLATGLHDIASIPGHFGFGLLERLEDGRWRFTAYDLDGRVMLTRQLPG